MKSIYRFLIALALFAPADRAFSQWVQTNGPYGRTVVSFAVAGTNLFAGTDGGGVFLSTNNGTSWTQSGLTDTHVLSLAVSPATGEAGGTRSL
jgi:hypothetical protein